jgi:hypothetical protein
MIKKQDNVNWDKKDAREYFSKSVNSMLMNSKDWKTDLDTIITMAKKIVDTMFEYWPADKDITTITPEPPNPFINNTNLDDFNNEL